VRVNEATCHKNKDTVMGRAVSRKANAHKVSVSKPVGNILVIICAIGGRILLKFMLKKRSWRLWNRSTFS
jgi:hypothetical protein